MLVYEDVRAAVAWLESAFGFEERVRIGDGHRAQLRVGSDGAVVVAEASADRVAPSGGGVTHILKVRVPDRATKYCTATRKVVSPHGQLLLPDVRPRPKSTPLPAPAPIGDAPPGVV